jgi:hypothetical protein
MQGVLELPWSRLLASGTLAAELFGDALGIPTCLVGNKNAQIDPVSKAS